MLFIPGCFIDVYYLSLFEVPEGLLLILRNVCGVFWKGSGDRKKIFR